jgi:hypothetical protein
MHHVLFRLPNGVKARVARTCKPPYPSNGTNLAATFYQRYQHGRNFAGGGRAGGAVPLVPRHANLRHGRVHLLLLWLLVEGPQGPQEDFHNGNPHSGLRRDLEQPLRDKT